MPKVSFQKLEPSWLLTKLLKIAQNCTSHKHCQKRQATTPDKQTEKSENLPKAQNKPDILLKN